MIGEMKRPMYQWLAEIQRVLEYQAARTAREGHSGISERVVNAWETARTQVMSSAPSGAGIDNGTVLVLLDDDRYRPGQIKFRVDFHHMDEHGFYDGWTKHMVTVRPDLARGFVLAISGRDRNEIKDYLYEVYYQWLREEIVPEPVRPLADLGEQDAQKGE